jgi:predicted glycogen debranching enzyme
MAPEANTSYLRIELKRATAPLRVTLKPLITYRDYHSQGRGAQPFQLESAAGECRVQAFPGARPYRLSVSQGEFTPAAEWYWNFLQRMEAERGLEALEDLLTPGSFTADLALRQPMFLTATAEAAAAAPGQEIESALRSAAQNLLAPLPRSAPGWIRTLARASDQFVVRRDDAGRAARSVIAGYPWFTDWGRDTMISLPGLATALKRYDLAADILRNYARFVDRGMLPNCFPDGGAAPQYNTADATLWMFHALDDYLQARRDPQLVRELFPILMTIIHAHAQGTRFGIGVDPADGLLHAGEAGTQLTWMDAKHGDQVFTPRIGKPVEINALWLNALDVSARLATIARSAVDRNFCLDLLARGTAGFSRFWNPGRGCLFDVIDTPGGADARVRPNQIFAVSLPYSALSEVEMRAVVDSCGRELLTSYGLRSLSPRDPEYAGRCEGDARQRDAAYHMGTVWAWLLGPFVRAHYRVYCDARLSQSFLAPIAEHLNGACMGTVGEIFDGDAPHTARGCFAQAWSVAEILRSWLYLERLSKK